MKTFKAYKTIFLRYLTIVFFLHCFYSKFNVSYEIFNTFTKKKKNVNDHLLSLGLYPFDKNNI